MKIIVSIVVCTLLAAQYKCNAQAKGDYVIYGTYAGECVGHCADMYKVMNDTLFMDPSNNFLDYDFGKIKNYVFKGIPLSKVKYIKAKKILDSIPNFLFISQTRRFGCPDCRDQGGIYLEIKAKDSIKSFFIDTDLTSIPAELRHYVSLLKENLYNSP